MVRLERAEGLKQAELAEQLDLQPITLTRLLDRLCDAGLIERRRTEIQPRVREMIRTTDFKRRIQAKPPEIIRRVDAAE
jgi:DNA-binding MarR family transcriptional regulator